MLHFSTCLVAGTAPVRAAAMFSFPLEKKTARRGREHLVDLERSEQIYLVIRDHKELYLANLLIHAILSVTDLSKKLREWRNGSRASLRN